MALSIRPLPELLQEKAIRELNEDPNTLEDNLKHIRKWAEKKSHIKIKPDDQWLVNFLRGCDFDLELAKYKLDLLYTVRPLAPEFLSNRDPFLPEIQKLLELGVCLPLPTIEDPVASRMALIRNGIADPTKHRVEDGIKLAGMILDIVLNEDDMAVINGGHFLVDSKGINFRHILQVTPSLIRKAIKCFYDAYPSKLQGIHVMNSPRIARIAFNAFKYLLNNELLNTIHFYGNDAMERIKQTIPFSVLPPEYGGTGPTLQELTDQWKAKVESYQDWFSEDEKYFSSKAKGSQKFDFTEDCPYIRKRCNYEKLEFD